MHRSDARLLRRFALRNFAIYTRPFASIRPAILPSITAPTQLRFEEPRGFRYPALRADDFDPVIASVLRA